MTESSKVKSAGRKTKSGFDRFKKARASLFKETIRKVAYEWQHLTQEERDDWERLAQE
jgi:hypothetical protein